ncbi:MAG: hypothetical protein IKJ71_03215 [Bacteroidaceae bacterium]|nr:hypothetical protein [Bacteroidaceae bacterium]
MMLLSCTLSHAQKIYSTPQEEEKKLDFSFRSIAVSADVFGFAYSLLEEFTSSEFAVEANFGNRIYPIAEVGLGWCSTTDETTGIEYKTNAPYYRVGVNYNFSTTNEKPNPNYGIFGIARFAWTSCEYDVTTPPIIDPVWGGTAALDLNGVKGTATWAEIGVGVRVKIAKNFHMGWSIRYKARISQEKASNSQMWYIPGYGINKSTCFGGTYNLIYEIPLR